MAAQAQAQAQAQARLGTASRRRNSDALVLGMRARGVAPTARRHSAHSVDLGTLVEHEGEDGASRRHRPRRRRSHRSKEGKSKKAAYLRGSSRRSRSSGSRSRSRSSSRSSRSSSSSSSKKDDSVGTFRGRRGDLIESRYEIVRTLGEGTFGRVCECVDLRAPPSLGGSNSSNRSSSSSAPDSVNLVAVKVVRAVPRYVQEARIEAEMLEEVLKKYYKLAGDAEGLRIVQLLDSFSWNKHYCLVFEPLGMSLYDLQQLIKRRPFSLDSIRTVARDIFQALEFLHEQCSIVHTDLKVENVLFQERSAAPQEPASYRVKLIDFGGATVIKPDKKPPTSVINTRQYRSPEVTLRIGWGFPSDIWSAGCILMELLLGDLLFATHDDDEHLALIARVAQDIPPHMRVKAHADAFKNEHRAQRSRFVQNQKSLEQLCQSRGRDARTKEFHRLIMQCLVVDPALRIDARSALEMPFLATASTTA